MLIESCRTSQRDVNGQIHTLEANDTITRQSYLQNPTQPCKNYTTEGHVDMGYVCLEQKIISSAQTFALPKLNESLIFQNENSARNIQTLALGEPHQGIYTTLPRISAHTEGSSNKRNIAGAQFSPPPYDATSAPFILSTKF